MIGQSLAHMDIAALQKAVLGMDPAIKPYAALAALQEKVKSQQMKQGQALQNPAQPPVAQQTMAQAQQLSPAQISNPYMASGLGAAPVQSPVQEPATGMASGGIVAFDEGGEVPRFAGPTGSRIMATPEVDNSLFGSEAEALYARAMAKYKAGQPLDVREQTALQQGNLQTGTRYADTMGAINETERLAKKSSAAPASGIAKALAFTSAPLAAGVDLVAAPFRAAGQYSFTNPLDAKESVNYTPALDARRRILDSGTEETPTTKLAASPAPASTDNRPYPERDLTTRPPGLASLVGKITPDAAKLKKEGPTKRAPANVADTPTEKPKAGLGQTDQASRYDTTPQYKTMDEFLAARKNAEKNTDVLPEDEYSKTLRQNLTKREERLAQAEKKGDQMAYLQAAGAFFGPGSLQQNASRAIPMFAEAKMKANSALEAAQEKATDAQDAWARYNQARQDGNKKDAREAFGQYNTYTNQAKQLQLTGQHYQDTAEHFRRADATGSRMADASMVAAQNRGLGGGGGGEKRQLDQLKALQTSLKDQLKDPMLSLPRNAAQKAALAKQLVEVNGAIAGMAGLNTMLETTLSPGAGGPTLAPLNSFYNK